MPSATASTLEPQRPRRRTLARAACVALAIFLAACSDAPTPPGAANDIAYTAIGPLSTAAGRGSFRFGAASAATQIEDQNFNTDWWLFTAPVAMGGLGHDTFVGDASRGYTRALSDVELLKQMHLDSYRFSTTRTRSTRSSPPASVR